MAIPIANAIFDNQINVNDFYKVRKIILGLSFRKADSKIFPMIKLKQNISV